MRATVLCLALLAPAGCFALKLDDFPAPRCASNADCDHLNRAEGIAPAACQRYQCAAQERVCVLTPRDEDGDGDAPVSCGGRDCDDANALRVGNPANARAREVCDGVDNNCDGVIDEGAVRRSPPTSAVMGLASPTALAAASRPGGGVRVAAGSAGAASTGRFGAAGSSGFEPLQYTAQVVQGGVYSQRMNACPVLDGANNVGFGSCGFDGLALAPLDASRWYALAVNTRGCAAGQLRAGWFEETARQVTLSVPASPMAVGVDVSGANACTGVSRMPAAAGASAVSLASIAVEGAAAKALGAWIARPANAPGCGAAANVEAMGLWLASARLMDATQVQGVRGTNGDRPVVLGATGGSGAPAVVTAGELFAVAYGVMGGGIRVNVIPAFAVPDGTLDTSRAPFALTGAATGSVDQLSAAAGPSRNGGFELGLAWKDGCAADGAVWFSRVAMNAANPGASTATDPVRIAAAGRRPVIAYSPVPMLVAGTRRGSQTVTAENAGGWVVAWVEGGRALARRVSAVDGAPVDDAPIALGDTAPDGPGVRLGTLEPRAMAGSASDEILYAMPDATGAVLQTGALVCRPR